jgi:putative hemolysin
MESFSESAPLGQIVIELLAIILLIVLNGVFAFSEIAIVSAKKVRLQQLAKKRPGAAVALELAEDPTSFLSTVQVGITLIGILAGALSGATLAENGAIWLQPLPLIGPYAEIISFTLVVVLVAYLSLTLGELVPKAMALNNPEGGAATMARPLRLVARAARPLVRVLSYSTSTILKVLRLEQTEAPPVTEEELKALVAEGARAGVFEPMERRLVEQALDLDDISLHPLLTHRVQVEWLDVADQRAEIQQTITDHDYTWFPLCDGGLDQVVGVVRARDVLLALADLPEPNEQVTNLEERLRGLAYPPLFIPLTAPPVKVLEMFRASHAHVAFAIDEYGGVEGIVTPFDVLEALVGELEQPPPPAEG